MNYFDIIVAVPLLWALYKGFKKGLVIEIASIIALGLGIWGGVNFSNFASEIIVGAFDVSSKMLPVLSFAVTFIAIVILVFTLAKMLEKIVKLVALGFVNRIFGALFGFLKISLICSVFIYLIELADSKYHFISQDFKKNSALYVPISKIAPTLLPLIKKVDMNGLLSLS